MMLPDDSRWFVDDNGHPYFGVSGAFAAWNFGTKERDQLVQLIRDSKILSEARDAALSILVEGVHDNDREAAVQRLVHILLVPNDDEDDR